MSHYLIGVYNGPDSRSRPAEEMSKIHAAVGAVNQKAIDDGIFVFAGGLHDQSATTSVVARDGKPELTDGPYLESKEYLGGFWLIDVPDLDAALSFAREAAVACDEPLEVRAFMEEPPVGS
ncbi:MAG: YciI family protein [Solirubrobacteraceae bacterium]